MKLLPFDLEKAQAGHPWGTRDGRKGKKIFDTEREGEYRLIAVLDDDDDIAYFIDGRFDADRKSLNDLFLYQESKKGWVMIYKDDVLGFQAIKIFDEVAKNEHEKAAKDEGAYLKTVEVEY